MRTIAAAFCLALLATTARAQAPEAPPAASNAEMHRIYVEDQADRTTSAIDWKVVQPRDEQRRAATRTLLAEGALHTGQDYREAAFIFQHGGQAGDYLLAHSLAVAAVGKGDHEALWIASATLDRYLVTIGQKQIYGTQFGRTKTPDAAWTQEPYDRELISDALRTELHVPTKAEQAKEFAAAQEYMRKLPAK